MQNKKLGRMASQYFHAHGDFCAAHPWEVITITVTLTACMLTVDSDPVQKPSFNTGSSSTFDVNLFAIDVVVMTLIRCAAILYCYYQFSNLHEIDSKYVFGIAGLFMAFSSFVFTSAVINFLRKDVQDLKDALFFFLLLVDLTKAARLAQFALISARQSDVRLNIAKGMSHLGPTVTLDTAVETLVIGVGTLSGVRRLEVLSWFACLSVVVNYLLFMTFYPACLSLILELSRNDKCVNSYSELTYDDKRNPIVERVKIIMSVGLVVVHVYSRIMIKKNSADPMSPPSDEETDSDNCFLYYIMTVLAASSDRIVIFILLITLVIKFIFFETGENLHNKSIPFKEMTNQNVPTENKQIQVNFSKNEDSIDAVNEMQVASENVREKSECVSIYEQNLDASSLTDEEVIMLIKSKHISLYQIEKAVKDHARGVRIRRMMLTELSSLTEKQLAELPHADYNYANLAGACCENVIGYVPIPVGVVGPLNLDGELIYVPMSTTEGCLVASTNRGCRALLHRGVKSFIIADGMTRAPVVKFPDLVQTAEAVKWIEAQDNFKIIKEGFDSTSRYARLLSLETRIVGQYLYLRFVAKTGDAMGMNMVSKGCERALEIIRTHRPKMEIISLSGNYCADKKPAAINWIKGRGKYTVCEAVLSAEVIENILKTNVSAIVGVNNAKAVGSAMAASIGGFNAHAANIVTAVFIATGQDPAQNVVSSNCMTLMEPCGTDNRDLRVSCTMPSLEVGTVGGGATLPAQAACLEMLGVRGPDVDEPGRNAKKLAKIICATVLAGELSLSSALAAGHLVSSHLKLNRAKDVNR